MDKELLRKITDKAFEVVNTEKYSEWIATFTTYNDEDENKCVPENIVSVFLTDDNSYMCTAWFDLEGNFIKITEEEN